MLKLINSNNLMRRIIKGPETTWIDIQNPTQNDITYLRKKYHFHPLVLGELLPPSYRPKIDHFDNYIFIVLYYPIYSKIKRETKPRELDIIVTRDAIITSHYKSILPLKALFDNCNLYEESKKTYMSEEPAGLFFYILDALWKSCLVKLNRIDERINKIEKDIFEGKEREMVKEISLVKTDIINFWRIVNPQMEPLESLEKEGITFFGKKFVPYFSDVLGSYHQARDSLESYKETILALEDTNQSLLSTKTSEIMKVLTIFSIIFLPLTLLSSIWGMNLSLPFAKYSSGFLIMLTIMGFLAILMLFIFHKKKWL
ncbi:MAG TPA: hypothetical protein ENH06_00715 [bacterium]|nr:hypothetical protein [bacterium]